MTAFSKFEPHGAPFVPPVDAALLLRICSMDDVESIETLERAPLLRLRWIRLQMFHFAMMSLAAHIRAVSRHDWSSSGLSAGQIVLANWRARCSWAATYARGMARLAGLHSIRVAPSALGVYDALALITSHGR